MNISQNLVYRKSTGEMIGFVNLEKNQVFADIAAMEKYLSTGTTKVQPEIATKMLSFMVKGVASSIKDVVASYSVNKLTSQFLYAETWEVINRCERSDIRIISFVSDGFAVNRSFLKKHTPARETKGGLIYATVNKSAPHRLLFFMSDVAHLIKTIRNSLSNSRLGKKSKRCLQKCGEKMLWQTIVDLYNAKRDRVLRKSYKLTAQHIYIDSYSAMKVRFAAQVLSKTVAQELEDMKWPGTKQLIEFIRRVNDWFDCLNGAFSTQGLRTRNHNLDPYTKEDDPRFEELEEFLQYLSDWKEEVYSLQALGNASQSFGGDDQDLSFDVIMQEERADNEANEVTEDTPAAKKTSGQLHP
ncbi:Transposable element P transposase [Frankliniella fusca]|uniref:Transposable element P transposase n=1 Tax=Frankliniella fusca TaxID=407009 RepID=A0AAE1I5J8_9NEOP|nr:Transposable element P transposase [Frankliniella fusca]